MRVTPQHALDLVNISASFFYIFYGCDALLKLYNEDTAAPSNFRWIAWNNEKMQKHGVSPMEAESVVRNAGRGFPRKMDAKKWVVIGRGQGGRMVQVIYLLDDSTTAFVIHAMPLTTRRRRR